MLSQKIHWMIVKLKNLQDPTIYEALENCTAIKYL